MIVETARNLIARHEGYRRFVYDDYDGEPIKPGMQVYGHPTIGYGIALDIEGIDESVATELLNKKVETLLSMLNGYEWFASLTDARKAVIVDMAYNMGIDGLLKFEKTIEALKNRDFNAASDEMLNSAWAKQTRTRADEDANIMRSGQFPAA